MRPIPVADQLAVQALLAEYGGLLDLGRYDDWLALFAAECRYEVVPRENYDAGLPVALILCDSRAMLEDRIAALRAGEQVQHPYRPAHHRPAPDHRRRSGPDRDRGTVRGISDRSRKARPGCSRPASTATGSNARGTRCASPKSWCCSTPSPSRRCSQPRSESCNALPSTRNLGRESMQAGGIIVERDLMVPARDGVGLATDVYRPAEGRAVPGIARTHALRQIGAEPVRAHRRRSDAALARRGRRLFRRARLCRRLSGLPRPLSLGGHVHEIPQRGRGRGRHARLADASELVRRQYRRRSACPMPRTPRRRSPVSTRRGWRRSSSIAAASRTPIAAASATVARST